MTTMQLLVTAVGALAASFIWYLAKRRLTPRPRGAKAEPKRKPEESYGHPRPPVRTLRSRLPEAPSGHVWEIKVQHDGNGTPFLYLGVVNVSSGATVVERKTDLFTNTNWPGGKVWARCYRDYPGIKSNTFDTDLIGPFLDWAAAQINRIANANKIGEYTIGDQS